jgi:hypothetical protein
VFTKLAILTRRGGQPNLDPAPLMVGLNSGPTPVHDWNTGAVLTVPQVSDVRCFLSGKFLLGKIDPSLLGGEHTISFSPAFLPVYRPDPTGALQQVPPWVMVEGGYQRNGPGNNFDFGGMFFAIPLAVTAPTGGRGILPVNLPDGALITSLFVCGATTGTLDFELVRIINDFNFGAANSWIKLIRVFNHSPGNFNTHKPLPVPLRVDNSLYTYLLIINFSIPTQPSDSTQNRVNGISFTYRL